MRYTKLMAVAVAGAVAGGSVLLGGCGSGPAAIQTANISEPGGFVDPAQRLVADRDEAYCDAQVLRWRYDVAMRSLQLADSRLLLNCCGQRDLQVERVDSLLEITERDAPSAIGGRCGEVCAFDYTVAVPDVASGKVYVKLLRDVTDAQGSAQLVWEGELDLAAGAGAVVLDDAPVGAACGDTARLAALAR